MVGSDETLKFTFSAAALNISVTESITSLNLPKGESILTVLPDEPFDINAGKPLPATLADPVDDAIFILGLVLLLTGPDFGKP